MNLLFDKLKEQYGSEIEAKLIKNSDQSYSALMSRYHIETGGKRIRAFIPLMIFEVLGANPSQAIPLGLAVEMIHNATLVHDDLQDGDSTRRGRPTIWKRFSSEQAINCGDAMFQYAYEYLSELAIEPYCVVKIMRKAAQATLMVIEGQAQEFLMKSENFPSLERYLQVIRGKTSGLLAFPITAALEALHYDEKFISQVEQLALDLGMLFQIQDDLLDIYGDKGRSNPASDIAEGKISFLVAHVYQNGSLVDKQTLQAILTKDRNQTTNPEIQQAIQIFDRYHAKAEAINYMRKIQAAIKSNAALNTQPKLADLLYNLSEIFLEPIYGII